MNKFTNRADLLIAAGESIKMQDVAGIEPICKLDGVIWDLKYKDFQVDPNRYEFPLAVVEGKPVFVGDELYYKGRMTSGEKCKILSNEGNSFVRVDFMNRYGICTENISDLSWNPPKPKTVMVELLREDAEWLAEFDKNTGGHFSSAGKACRKSLEKK